MNVRNDSYSLIRCNTIIVQRFVPNRYYIYRLTINMSIWYILFQKIYHFFSWSGNNSNLSNNILLFKLWVPAHCSKNSQRCDGSFMCNKIINAYFHTRGSTSLEYSRSLGNKFSACFQSWRAIYICISDSAKLFENPTTDTRLFFLLFWKLLQWRAILLLLATSFAILWFFLSMLAFIISSIAFFWNMIIATF